MAKQGQLGLYTLPFGRDLCDAAVDLIFKQCGDDPLALTKAIVLLPNNRAIRSMNDAFVRRAAPGLLMPRLVAVGDHSLGEALGPLFDTLDFGGDEQIPAVIDPLARKLILAQLVTDIRAKRGEAIMPAEALRLARLLGELIDELDIEQISIDDFKNLSSDSEISDDPDLAGHWQAGYADLLHILPSYRAAISNLNLCGPADRRNMLLGRFAEKIRQDAPDMPIFAVGISTAAPVISALLRAVAHAPGGHVILPPVDLSLSDDDWEELGCPPDERGEGKAPPRETHPQYHLKMLIERMGVNRSEFAMLADKSLPEKAAKDNEANHSAISNIFCLPAASKGWNALPEKDKNISGLRIMKCADSAEEATAIAILVRAALEQEGKRISIVTPDRELAGRVKQQLLRWGIQVDDSAGVALLQTAEGTLLSALLNAAAEKFSLTSLLAVAKHPLVKMGDERRDWLAMVRQLDMALRGPAAALGLGAIEAALKRKIAATKDKEKRQALEKLTHWWADYSDMLSPMDTAADGEIPDMLAALVKIAGILTNDQIWRGATGRQISAMFEGFLAQDFSKFGNVPAASMPEIFSELCQGETVRAAYGGHPRVALLGLLEARLQQADMLICAGLNEGSWPQLPKPDPWLAPRIRRDLGLSGLERNIGLAAHDLACAIGARECVITRAQRDRSGPAKSSRFLLRIEAFLAKNIKSEDDAIAMARQIDRGEKQEFAKRPNISPTADQRAIELSITDFDGLLADPFAFYAKKIMRLGPIDDVDAEPGAAWKGSLVHDLLEQWALEDNLDPEKLMQRAHDILSDKALHPNLRTMWYPRIIAGIEWVARHSAELISKGYSLAGAEVSGNVEISGVNIRGRADRIDRMPNGDLVIIDYKTGHPPKAKQINAGFALQLGLLAHIANENGFKGLSGKPDKLEYWSLAKKQGRSNFGYDAEIKGGKDGAVISNEDPVEDMVARARDAIEAWIFGDEPFDAKRHPEFAPYAEFDQLSRLSEWDGRQQADQGDEK